MRVRGHSSCPEDDHNLLTELFFAVFPPPQLASGLNFLTDEDFEQEGAEDDIDRIVGQVDKKFFDPSYDPIRDMLEVRALEACVRPFCVCRLGGVRMPAPRCCVRMRLRSSLCYTLAVERMARDYCREPVSSGTQI